MKNKKMPSTTKKRSVLIFGAYGLLGSDLSEVFSKDWEVIRISHTNTDIADKKDINNAIEKYSPELIINAAAHNKVEEQGETIDLLYRINTLGPFYIAKAADKLGIPFVHISTNYVFDGSKDVYFESDQPNPVNLYGASKLAGEQLVKIIAKQYYIIRTSALFGNKKSTKGSDFITKMLELSSKDETIKAVDDQIINPTSSRGLAEKIYEIIEKLPAFGIYHITNSGSASWFKFAQEIFTNKNIQPNLIAIQTTESDTKIQRPKRCILESTKLAKTGITSLPPWQDALRRHLDFTE